MNYIRPRLLTTHRSFTGRTYNFDFPSPRPYVSHGNGYQTNDETLSKTA